MSRLDQLVQWCGEDFDGLILYDECHKVRWSMHIMYQPQVGKYQLMGSCTNELFNAVIVQRSLCLVCTT